MKNKEYLKNCGHYFPEDLCLLIKSNVLRHACQYQKFAEEDYTNEIDNFIMEVCNQIQYEMEKSFAKYGNLLGEKKYKDYHFENRNSLTNNFH